MSRAYGFDLRTTRLAIAVAAIMFPAVFVAYGLCWMLLPRSPEEPRSFADVIKERRRRPLLIVLGLAALTTGFGSLALFGGAGWGVTLIAIGVLLWLSPNFGSDFRRTSPSSAGDHTGGGQSTGMDGAAHAPSAPSTPRRRRYPVQALGLLIAIVTALVVGLGNSQSWWHVSTYDLLVTLLSILIAGTLIGFIVNRSWFGVPMMIVLAFTMAGLLITHPNLEGGQGDRTLQPSTLAQAEQPQHLGTGRLTIDLTTLPATEQALSLSASVGFGQLRIIVAPSTRLEVTSHLGGGHLVIDGQEVLSGLRQSDTRVVNSRTAGASTPAGPRAISLDLEVGGGEISIEFTG